MPKDANPILPLRWEFFILIYGIKTPLYYTKPMESTSRLQGVLLIAKG